jgi:hypothetical protein
VKFSSTRHSRGGSRVRGSAGPAGDLLFVAQHQKEWSPRFLYAECSCWLLK